MFDARKFINGAIPEIKKQVGSEAAIRKRGGEHN